MTVAEVSASPRACRLAGYVMFKAPGSDQVQQKNCTAAMTSDKATTWSCQ
jgi:hypothetical protein